MKMWIDTHTHFDAGVFDATRAKDWAKAQSLDVVAQFVMGVSPSNFTRIEQLASDYKGTYFALGIHPMAVMPLEFSMAFEQLKTAVERNLTNPRFIGIGEIGLDGFVDNLDWDKQVDFFVAQLKLARDYDLPVYLHIRKAQDQVLKYVRRFALQRGIAHAFNGSEQQAERYLKQGFKLGFGGAMTFSRANNLHRLVKNLPLSAFVLETDSPDMSPAWVSGQCNYSYHLPRIAEEFSQLRLISLPQLSTHLWNNVLAICPQLTRMDEKCC